MTGSADSWLPTSDDLFANDWELIVSNNPDENLEVESI